MKVLLEYINSISPINKDTEAILDGCFEKKIVDKNYTLVKSGQVAKELIFLEAGIIRTFYRKDDGTEYNKAFDVPPMLTCGYSSLITGNPSRINLETLTECVLWVTDYTTFCNLYDKYPDLERAARIAAEKSFVEKENRELEMALLNASERYELFKEQFKQLEQVIPQYQIASYLGITPTQLSRIRSHFKKRKR